MGHIVKKGFMVLTFLLAVIMITGCYDQVSFTKDKAPYEYSNGPIFGDSADGKPVGLVAGGDKDKSINILSSDVDFNYEQFVSDYPTTDFLWLKMAFSTEDGNGLATVIEGIIDGKSCLGAAKSSFFYVGEEEKIGGTFFGGVVCDDGDDQTEDFAEPISGRFTVALMDAPITVNDEQEETPLPFPEINDEYDWDEMVDLLQKAGKIKMLERWLEKAKNE